MNGVPYLIAACYILLRAEWLWTGPEASPQAPNCMHSDSVSVQHMVLFLLWFLAILRFFASSSDSALSLPSSAQHAFTRQTYPWLIIFAYMLKVPEQYVVKRVLCEHVSSHEGASFPGTFVSKRLRGQMPLLENRKRTPKPKNRTNSTKEFSEQF